MAEPISIDVDLVAQELNLSDERKSELTPVLNRLGAVLERRQEHWQKGDEILDDLDAAYEDIAGTLTSTELREFHWYTRTAITAPWSGGRMDRYVRGGRMWDRSRWGPGMRGGRGYTGRGRSMRGGRGYGCRGVPMRDGRGGARWNTRPGWRPDGL